MDTGSSITFPSPSALLRKDPDNSIAEPPSGPVARAPKEPKVTSKTQQKSMKPKVTHPKEDASVKPKQSKSRNGCTTCKQKRLKCDETKPACKQCERRKVECAGYKKDYKWRPFEEVTFTNKASVKPRPKKLDPPTVNYRSEKVSSKVPPCPSIDLSSSTSPETLSDSPPSIKAEITFPDAGKQTGDLEGRMSDFDDASPLRSSFASAFDKSCGDPFDLSPAVAGETFWDIDQYQDVCNALSMPEASSNFFEDSLPDADLDLDGFWYAPDSLPPFEPVDDDSHEVAKAIEQSLDSNSQAMMDGDSIRDDMEGMLLNRPLFNPTTPEMLLRSFDRVTCGILSVRDGPTENPWRNAILPLVHESKTLYHAVVSLTAFHASKLHPQMKVVGVKHMEKSVRSLAKGLTKMRPDLALASTLVLAFAESWDVHVSTGIKHLIGAKACIAQALPLMKRLGPDDPLSKRIKFLCNTWVYMDVIARLTCLDADESTDFDAVMQMPGFPLDEDMEVDPLMGCAASLFPLLGRVANLVRKVRKAGHNSISIISQASELKAAIEAWSPPQMLNKPEDELCDVQDAIKTAEAYRWATLLYLHQAVPEMPSLPAAELARNALVAIALVPSTSRNTIVHIYPLLAAGCEASTAEDREWVVNRWEGMSRRMLIGNVDRCLEVVKEVWDRRDQYEAEACYFGTSLPESCASSMPPSPIREHVRSFSSEDVFSSTWNLADMGQSLLVDDDFHELGTPQRSLSTTPSWSKGLSMGTSAPSKLELHRFDGSGGFRSRRNANPKPHGRRSMSSDMASTSIGTSVRNALKNGAENIMFERTVRGSQHWVGVMEDWNWEVLLG